MSPIFEYNCEYCGNIFDKIVYSSDPEITSEQPCSCGSYAKKALPKVAQAVGNFGTPRRNHKRTHTKFNFTNDEPETDK